MQPGKNWYRDLNIPARKSRERRLLLGGSSVQVLLKFRMMLMQRQIDRAVFRL